MDLSIIVISQDFEVLNKLLNSINDSNRDLKIEVLCSGNENNRIDKNIIKNFNFPFKVLPFNDHNYAKNYNKLANKAKGKVLLFLNEEIILDENSLQTAWNKFQEENTGILGINLRYSTEKIQHAGVYFKEDGTPYNRFENKLNYEDKRLTSNRIVPAVRDFLMVDRNEFLQMKFDERLTTFEDVVLCLQYQNKFDKDVFYVGEATAIYGGDVRDNTISTPSEDLEQIKIAYKKCEEKVNSIIDDYCVSIITDKPGWILHRMASEIKLKNVLINEDVPDADITYYINYFLHNKNPSYGVAVGNFTHYDPDLYKEEFIQSAEELEHCISISEETTKIMKSLNIDENKISTVLIGADKSFKPKLTLGIVALIKKNSDRKGENLVKAILEDEELMEDMQIVSLNDCWDLPIWNIDHADFYRSIDYLLVPSLIEGGPVPFMEALACGTLSIAPPIGVIPQFPHIEYETGNISSLKSTITMVKSNFLVRKQKISSYMEDYNWDTWSESHDKIFKKLLFDLE